MSPNEIKSKVQGVYLASLRSNTYYSRGSSLDHILRDIYIFGREAGIDFANTYVNTIVQEALDVAKTRERLMQITFNKGGKDALEGAAETLHALTGLSVTALRLTITISWADESNQVI